jgi:hypothetical protein
MLGNHAQRQIPWAARIEARGLVDLENLHLLRQRYARRQGEGDIGVTQADRQIKLLQQKPGRHGVAHGILRAHAIRAVGHHQDRMAAGLNLPHQLAVTPLAEKAHADLRDRDQSEIKVNESALRIVLRSGVIVSDARAGKSLIHRPVIEGEMPQ